MANYQFNIEDIKKKQQGVLVSNTDEVFAGTSLEFKDFTIAITYMSRVDKINFDMNVERDEEGTVKDLGQFSKDSFLARIGDIEGFDVVDNQNKVYSEEELKAAGINKLDFLYDEAEDILMEAIRDAIDKMDGKEVEKKKAPEPDSIDTPIG